MDVREPTRNSSIGGLLIPPESTNGGGKYFKSESKTNNILEFSSIYVNTSDTKAKDLSDFQIKYELNSLIKFQLQSPLDIIIENDEDGYIVRTVDFPLYSYADDLWEAINGIKYEIESLYEDLNEGSDEGFSKEWLYYKKVLSSKIVE